MDLLKDIDPTRAVAFSGHRPDRLPGKGDPSTPETSILIVTLREQIKSAIDRGMIFYLHGCMAGFDILAAEQIITLKQQYPHIQLVTVAPYAVHFFSREKCWTPDWVRRAREVCRQSDIGMSLSEHYCSGIYYERNKALIDRSSELICYWDGGDGGTKYTVDLAKAQNKPIINIAD